MARKQKIDYAALFSYDENTGLYYANRTINGKRRYFRSKDPEALFHKLNTALENDGRAPSFREVAEAWQEAKWPTIRPKTQECYEAPLARALAEYGRQPIDELTAADINRLILRMKDEGFSSQTVKDQKAVLNMIFNYAITRQPPLLQHNPCAAVKVPAGLPKTKRAAPDDDVMQRIISSVDSATFGLFPFLLLYTGCRRGEALALTWADIDRENARIRIDKAYTFQNGKAVLGETKTEAGGRYMPLLPALAARLIPPAGAKPTDLIFHATQGGPLCESSFKRRWRHFCIDAGIIKTTAIEKKDKAGKPYIWHRVDPALAPHQLRHGYATLLFEAGIEAKTAQEWLGHADVHTTQQIYTDIRAKKEKLDSSKFATYMETSYENKVHHQVHH